MLAENVDLPACPKAEADVAKADPELVGVEDEKAEVLPKGFASVLGASSFPPLPKTEPEGDAAGAALNGELVLDANPPKPPPLLAPPALNAPNGLPLAGAGAASSLACDVADGVVGALDPKPEVVPNAGFEGCPKEDGWPKAEG